MSDKKLNVCLIAEHYVDIDKMMAHAKKEGQLKEFVRQPSLATADKLIAKGEIDVLVLGPINGVPINSKDKHEVDFHRLIDHARKAHVAVFAYDSSAANKLNLRNKCYNTFPVPGQDVDESRNNQDKVWDRIYKLATSPRISKKVEGGVSKNGI